MIPSAAPSALTSRRIAITAAWALALLALTLAFALYFRSGFMFDLANAWLAC